MTDNTATVINQLRVVLDLTHTEIQVAETRIGQARTEPSAGSCRRMPAMRVSAPVRWRKQSVPWVDFPMSWARSSVARLRW
jgi:hypothetical protein